MRENVHGVIGVVFGFLGWIFNRIASHVTKQDISWFISTTVSIAMAIPAVYGCIVFVVGKTRTFLAWVKAKAG